MQSFFLIGTPSSIEGNRRLARLEETDTDVTGSEASAVSHPYMSLKPLPKTMPAAVKSNMSQVSVTGSMQTDAYTFVSLIYSK